VVKLTFYGHSCFAIDSAGTIILIDPFLTGNPQAAITADEVKANYILVSHGHGDHLGDTIAIAKRNKALVIANCEVTTYCQKHRVEAHPLHIGGGYSFPFGKVKLTIAHHGSSFPDGSYAGNPCGFLVSTGGKVIYHACDTGLFYDMKLIGDRNALDVAILPIGGNFTMDADDAAYATGLLHPKLVIPCHYNTFDVIQQEPKDFQRKVEAETKVEPKVKCVILKPGESYSL
jgi:L-ascorbate metabolism protein UlaG (beta-lactamase superfamily)